jgi:membrane-associated phospholipid phosphatase
MPHPTAPTHADQPVVEPTAAATPAVTRRAAWHRLPLLFVSLLGAGLLGGALVRPGHASGTIQFFDDQVRAWVLAHRTPSLVHALRPVTQFGAPLNVFALAALASLALLAFGSWRRALVPLVAVLGTDTMVAFLKHAVGRPGTSGRIYADTAFPSGHMSGITTLLVPLAVLAWTTRRWWWPAVVAVLAMATMAATLLVLDVHWFTDVVAGAALTGTWATAVALWVPRRSTRREPRALC